MNQSALFFTPFSDSLVGL